MTIENGDTIILDQGYMDIQINSKFSLTGNIILLNIFKLGLDDLIYYFPYVIYILTAIVLTLQILEAFLTK